MVRKMGKNKEVVNKASYELSEFLTFIRKVEIDYLQAKEDMEKEDRLTQDYLHLLELGGLTTDERSRVATQIVKNRQNRRKAKDTFEELSVLYDFYIKNKKFFNDLQQVLGELRKQENRHKDRVYIPRVINLESLGLQDKMSFTESTKKKV